MDKSSRVKFNLSNINSITEKTSGIYAFWMIVKDGWVCVYIGESGCVKQRLTNHWKNSYSAGDKFMHHKKVFGRYYYFCYSPADPNEKKRRTFENKLIAQWNPLKNTKRPR